MGANSHKSFIVKIDS